MKIFISIIFSILLANSYAKSDTCRGLILAAGGDLGAYEAGVLAALVENLPDADVQWDIFSGISVGAITAAGLNQWPCDESVQMIEWVKSIWMSISFSDVLRMWPNGGLISGLLFQTGIVDNSPLRNFLMENLDYSKGPQKKLLIGAVDVQTGELIRFNETSFATKKDLVEGILASAAVPGLFPISELFGYQFFDGGVASGQDIVGTIDRCRKDGYNDSQIHLDLIFVTSNDSMTAWGPGDKKKTMEVYNRQQTLNNKDKWFIEYLEARDLYPQVDFRYFIKPSKPLPWNKFPFTFIHSDLEKMIDQGYADGLNAIKKGPGVSAQEAYEEAENMQFVRMHRLYSYKQSQIIQEIM